MSTFEDQLSFLGQITASRPTWGHDEATRDPIFLAQYRRRWPSMNCIGYHERPRCVDCEKTQGEGCTCERTDGRDPSYEPFTGELFRACGECEEHWETDSVWLSRAEAESWMKARAYRFSDGHRVYCVTCDGELSVLLASYAALCAAAAMKDDGQRAAALARLAGLVVGLRERMYH